MTDDAITALSNVADQTLALYDLVDKLTLDDPSSGGQPQACMYCRWAYGMVNKARLSEYREHIQHEIGCPWMEAVLVLDRPLITYDTRHSYLPANMHGDVTGRAVNNDEE